MDQMTIADLQALPAVVDLRTAAQALGLGRTLAYQLARRGEFPCRVLRLGSAYRVSTADLLRVLGVDTEVTPPAASATGATSHPAGGVVVPLHREPAASHPVMRVP